MNKKDPIFSSSTMYIPDDLVIEILSRLPTKSLSRFRCVSKLWTTLISHVTSQRTIFLPMPGLFCYTFTPPIYITELYVPISPKSRLFKEVFDSRLSSLPFYSEYAVTHCCNGLLLFIGWGEEHLPSRLIVWNPATMEFVHLPGQVSYDRSCTRYFLAYDPRKSPHYKVFEFTLHTNDTLINVDMYSSMTGTWDRFCSITHQHPLVCGLEGPSVFHKGALYMITTSQDYVKDYLFRFDTNEGSFDFIILPGKPAIVEHVCIGESRGHLYCAVDYSNPEFKREIYMLDEKNSVKWVLTHKMSTWNGDPHAYQPIAFHPESELIFLSMRKKMISYNPNNSEFEEIFVATENLNLLRASLLIPCLESLDPPGSKLINSVATDNSM